MLAPIGERFQIKKFAAAKTILAPQTENGNRHARATPRVVGQVGEAVVDERVFVACNLIDQHAIRTVLETDETIRSDIKDAVFIGEGKFLAA